MELWELCCSTISPEEDFKENVSRVFHSLKGNNDLFIPHSTTSYKTFMPLILKLELILLKPIPSQDHHRYG
jgi:hypothetical protein